jgi:hypothetical protein
MYVRPRQATIERQPRAAAKYEPKVGQLDSLDRLTVELVEESILADLNLAHRRRVMPDGTEFDKRRTTSRASWCRSADRLMAYLSFLTS